MKQQEVNLPVFAAYHPSRETDLHTPRSTTTCCARKTPHEARRWGKVFSFCAGLLALTWWSPLGAQAAGVTLLTHGWNPPSGTAPAFATWHHVRRAEHYRVLLMIVGVDADYCQVAERDECDAALADLPARALVRAKIVAMNDASDGPASEVVEIQMP